MKYSDELFVVSLSLSLIQRTLSIHLLNPALFQEGFSICKFSHFSLHLFFSSLNFELNLNVYVFCYLYIIVQSIFPTDSMSSQGGSTLSLSSSLTPRWKHDVFLSLEARTLIIVLRTVYTLLWNRRAFWPLSRMRKLREEKLFHERSWKQ